MTGWPRPREHRPEPSVAGPGQRWDTIESVGRPILVRGLPADLFAESQPWAKWSAAGGGLRIATIVVLRARDRARGEPRPDVPWLAVGVSWVLALGLVGVVTLAFAVVDAVMGQAR